MLVERTLADAHGGGDVPHTDPGVPPLGKEAQRPLQNDLLGISPGHAIPLFRQNFQPVLPDSQNQTRESSTKAIFTSIHPVAAKNNPRRPDWLPTKGGNDRAEDRRCRQRPADDGLGTRGGKEAGGTAAVDGVLHREVVAVPHGGLHAEHQPPGQHQQGPAAPVLDFRPPPEGEGRIGHKPRQQQGGQGRLSKIEFHKTSSAAGRH